MPEPEPFHDAMQAAINGDDSALTPWLATPQAGGPGLAVYRNTIAKARADALAALYPTVVRLVGGDWFRDAALIHARSNPPDSPVMDDYGRGFADWLETFPPAVDLPFLAPIARIDRAWSEAHRAPEAPVMSAADFAMRSPAELFRLRARLHPSLRLFWFDWTVPSVWLANRPDSDPDIAVVWEDQSEGLLLSRPEGRVRHHRLSHAQWRFLDLCRRGLPLGQAAARLRLDHPTLDLSRLFAELIGMGVFAELQKEPRHHDIAL